MNEIEDNLTICSSSVLSERVDAYNIITRKLSSQHQSFVWGENVGSEKVKKIINNVKQDIFCKEKNIAFETTGFLGCFLDNEKLMDCLSVEDEQETFDSLIKLLETCEDNKILNRALWCFAQSKFGCDIYNKNINKILNVIKSIMEVEQTSITRYEALQVIKSLLESSPMDMIEKINIWFSLVFNNFFHETSKVRGIAYSCMLICRNIPNIENSDILYNELVPFVADLKDKHCKAMSSLMDEDCNYILKIWRLIVSILGKHLHPGTALINGLLEVVEKAFKSSRPDSRVDAFKCWQILISNFALDLKVINHPKRLKLLSAPFKSSNNAKTEEIANAKLSAWWHLVIALGEHCSDHFDSIIVPLLKNCFHTTATSGFERMHTMAGAPSPARKYPGLHIKSIEMLSAILNDGNLHTVKTYSLSIPELKQKIMTPSVFLRNYQLIFSSVGDALQILSLDNSKQFSLGLIILTQLAQHVRVIIDSEINKKECVEMVKDLLSTTIALEKANESNKSFLLEFMIIFISGNLALPNTVMNSRQYNIPVSTKPQELVSGTLSNFFVHKLLKPSMLIHKSKEIYKQLWDELLQKSNPSCGKLCFFEFALDELYNAAPTLCYDSVDIFVDLWIQICSHLHDYIQQENTIDQGDGSDYDWKCMYKYFLFPIRNSQDHLGKIEDSSNYQKIVAMLNKLWTIFTPLCSLTTTAEPNCESDFVAKQMISLLTEKFTGPPDAISFTLLVIAELLCITIGQFRFKDLGKKSMKAVQSPARPKKKPHVLHNLGGCIDLLCVLMEKSIRIVSSSRGKVMAKIAQTATQICKNIPKKYAWNFISSFCDVLRKAIMINPSAKYTPDVEAIFVEMYNEYINCLQKYIGKSISNDQLSRISALLIAGLTSTHDGIKQKTKDLWYNYYSSTKVPIPANLYEVLKAAGLPPASISDTLTESQDTFYKSPGGLSGKRPSKVNPSPVKSTPKPVRSTSASKTSPKSAKKSIFEMKDEDFVKISSPSVNKRFLTPHQVEKMKNRGNDIPALYSDLSQSTSQLPLGFTTQDSIDQSSSDNSRCKQLFPPIEKKKLVSKQEETIPIDCVLSPEKESHSKNYSDEELNEVLKDTSLELEKSLTESEKSLSIVNNNKVEEKENRSERKRKLATPSKKSIDDVRKSLKGTKFAEKSTNEDNSNKIKNSSAKVDNDKSIKRQPLRNVHKSPKKANIPTKKLKEVVPDSDEEIPCSQIEEDTASKSIISKIGIDSPCGQDRPRRNKRKCMDDGYVYTTPTKKVKVSPMKIVSSVVNSMESKAIFTPAKKLKETPKKIDASKSKSDIKSSTNAKAVELNTVIESNPKASKQNISPNRNANQLDVSPDLSSGSGVHMSTSPLVKKRGRSRGGKVITEVQKLKHDNFDFEPKLLGSPTKVTRSGRRIVAPKKEIPEPITPISQNKEEQKTSLQKKPHMSKISPKAAGSPLASPIVSPLKVVSTEKCSSIRPSPEIKGDSGSVKPNRRLFDDSPKKVSSPYLGTVTEINERSPKYISKSPSPKKLSFENLKRSVATVSDVECETAQLSAKRSPKQTLKRVSRSPIEDQSNSEINTRKRKRMETMQVDSKKSKSTNQDCSSIQESDCVAEKNENPTNIEEKNTPNKMSIIQGEDDIQNKSENHHVDSKNDQNAKIQQITEDENMNMVKESSEGNDQSEKSPKYTGPTSFSGLINKKNETVAENQSKTTTVIWSPSIQAINASQEAKKVVKAQLPYIYVRNCVPNTESSPIRKTQMLVLGQSPSSTNKSKSPIKNSLPDDKPSKLSSQMTVPISNLEDEKSNVVEINEALKKQESPLRLSRSRLSDTISTPEVHQLRKDKINHRSRAAAMLARAQQTMKNKAIDTSESPRCSRFSRGSKSLPNGSSSPFVGRKTIELSSGPWARFEPSPNASPSNGILKRHRILEEDCALIDSDFETSPCVTKSRRVSFAYPVFESIEIPPSPKVLRNMRAQKKLDMTNSCSSNVKEAMPLKEVNKELNNDRVLDSSKPIYPELSNCSEPVDKLISELALPEMTNGLFSVLQTSSVKTVGDMALLTESELHMFPVRSPKTEITLGCLKKFAANSQNSQTDSTVVDEVNPASTETSSVHPATDGVILTNKNIEANQNTLSNATDEEMLQEVYSRLENNSSLVQQFCEKVSQSRKQDIFESLLTSIPYSKVIDIYSDFLKKPHNL